MEFVDNLSQKEYMNFWKKTPNNHFMQDYAWGTSSEMNRGQIPCYVGLKDDKGKLVICALLLKKKTPLNMCYFYSPRGFTSDYKDPKILEEFTIKLKEYLKKENAIYLKLDPPIKYQTIDMEANPIEGENNYELFNTFISLGYKHCGFNKLYEGNQPRYTFRTYFKNYNSVEEVEKSMSKSYLRNKKYSHRYDLKIEFSDDVKTFHDLIKVVSSRDGFREYSLEYYQNIYNEYAKEGHVKIFNALFNPAKVIKKFEEEIETEKNQDRVTKLKKEIEYFKTLENQKEQVVASFIVTYSETGVWSLYLGSNELAEKTYAVARLYYEIMMDAYNNHYEYLDLFGTVGDPHTKYKNLAGIFEHKRLLGGEYIEFIGEFDLINKPFWYKVLPILLKVYRKLKK